MEAEEDVKPVNDPCVVCGYSRETHGKSLYNNGAVKLFEIFPYEGDWQLGSRHFIKDQVHKHARIVPAIHTFLQMATTIPVSRIMAFWEEPGGRLITIEERALGENLGDVWPSLSETERDDIAQQTANYLKQLRGLQSNRIENVHGTPVHSDLLFDSFSKPSGPFDTNEEFWEAMAEPLRKSGLPKKAIDAIGKRMPSPEPYTFTYAGIQITSIIIKDKKVVGINEWLGAGYLPCWYEYAVAGTHGTITDVEIMDGEWKKILRPKLERYDDGAKWLSQFVQLSHYPNLSDAGVRLLKELEDQTESLESKLAEVDI
ncbi:hypothetical protein F5883DRAFT_419306 [Diaporthe sp. PMI_573]|nr:hypothetical protein F5883DRAFT_419306 [Diaporthaceae sp. PMI_573]